jgi:hypothetical protein
LDPTANNLYSLLKFYDVLNQPTLGNPSFFAVPGEVSLSGFSLGKMYFPRLAMSGAAWLKVYAENPNFFRQFNEAYYAQINSGLPFPIQGNVPALRGIARTFAPNVEGQAFDAWYEQQFVLDTSVSVGKNCTRSRSRPTRSRSAISCSKAFP